MDQVKLTSFSPLGIRRILQNALTDVYARKRDPVETADHIHNIVMLLVSNVSTLIKALEDADVPVPKEIVYEWVQVETREDI